MRKIYFVLASLLVCVIGGGCYESLTTIVTPDKLVVVDKLAGEYQLLDPGSGRVTIEKGKGKTYGYKQFDAKGAPLYKGTLCIVKLGDEHFYQITLDGITTADNKPVYVIGRLHIEGTPGARTLTGFAFNSPATFFGDASVGTVDYEFKARGEAKKGRAASAPTEKLQAFLAEHAADMTSATLKLKQVAPAR
jgi:hypothetical protein